MKTLRAVNKISFSFLILITFCLSIGQIFGQEGEKPRLFHYNDGEVEKGKGKNILEEREKEKKEKSEEKEKEKLDKKKPSLSGPSSQPPKKQKRKKSPEEIEEEISKNEQFTIQKYREILESEKFEVKNLKNRIQANEKLVSQYRRNLHLAQKELEKVRVELTTKAILLKRSKDEGRISEAEFNKEFKRINDRLKMESSELKADVEFYKRELSHAENTLRRLREELKVKEEAQRVARAYEKKHGGKRKFTNAEFEKIYHKFKALLPRKLKPVFVNNPFKSPFLRDK